MSCVFIADDFMLNEMFSDMQAQLEARGIDVVRGPASVPGKKTSFPPESWPALFGRADVMMFSSRSIASRELMMNAPRLRAIVNPTIGLETVDVEAASELGIIVGHGATPENYLGMAEATVMLMLMLLYKPRLTEEVLRGERERPPPSQAWAQMIRGRTIGLIGLGRIARGVVERLSGFGVNIIAHDPYVKAETVPANVKLVELDALLASSDIVSVLVSIGADSRGMIGERELGLMKPSAYLINTARGEAIAEAALYRALAERRIAGAALDSFVTEPLPHDSPLRTLSTLDNVILTPHMIGHTQDVFASFPIAAIENITRVLRGELPLHCKNPEIEPRWRERLARLELSSNKSP